MNRRRRQYFFFRSFVIAGQNFVRDECTTASSAISFVFLLAVIPFAALFLFILKLLQSLFLPGYFPDDLVTVLVEDINQLIPFVSPQWLRTHLVESVGLGSFTTVNLFMLPIISGLLFKSLDEAYRKIFQMPRRSILKGHAAYAGMSVFAVLLFFMFNFIWTIVSDATRQVQAVIEQTDYYRQIYAHVLHEVSMPQVNIVSWLILVLFFLTTAKVFLTTPIKLRHRLAAGAVFGLLWIAARQCFGIYIQKVARINVLFGSLGSVCIVLLWVFYSSVALLYSVEFMYVQHCGPYRIWERSSGPDGR